MKYCAREVNVIEAEQFLPKVKVPEGVTNVHEAPYGWVGQVRTLQGETVTVHEGEWIVEEEGNNTRHYPIADEVFQRKYRPV